MTKAGVTIVLRGEDGQEYRATVAAGGSVTVNDETFTIDAAADQSLRFSSPRPALAWTAVSGETSWVFIDGEVFTFEAQQASRPRKRAAAHHGSLTAPMPATVRQVAVSAGDRVRRGDVLIVLEAMKMELPVRSTADGRVLAINCREGDLVQPGQDLIDLEAS